MSKVIALASGGLDSTTLLYLLRSEGHEIHALSFDYGQRHRKELEFARHTTARLGFKHDLVDLSGLTCLIPGSCLTDDLPVPQGHYAAPEMVLTVVPNRNAVLLAIAYAVAVAERAEMVAFAVHAGDRFVYPDCRLAFLDAFEGMERLAVQGFGNPDLRLSAPFRDMTKAEVVVLGSKLGVPFTKTWTCYEGRERHCGSCGACSERKEAFVAAGITDPTGYAGP